LRAKKRCALPDPRVIRDPYKARASLPAICLASAPVRP
jgi:hypothetical protein